MADGRMYLAWYTSWPNAATVVGVFTSKQAASDALAQSDGPPEGYHVSLLWVDERLELMVSDGL